MLERHLLQLATKADQSLLVVEALNDIICVVKNWDRKVKALDSTASAHDAPPMQLHKIGNDAEQPGTQRAIQEFLLAASAPRLHEHLRRDVLGKISVVGTATHEPKYEISVTVDALSDRRFRMSDLVSSAMALSWAPDDTTTSDLIS